MDKYSKSTDHITKVKRNKNLFALLFFTSILLALY